MAGVDVRISELPAATEGHADDRFETTQIDGATLVSRSITLEQVSDAVAAVLPPPAADWDSITGKPATFPPTLPIPESGVTNLVSDLAAKAPLASPTFTGDPKAPTPTAGDNDTSIATTAFVTTAVAAIPAVTVPAGTVAFGGVGGAVTGNSTLAWDNTNKNLSITGYTGTGSGFFTSGSVPASPAADVFRMDVVNASNNTGNIFRLRSGPTSGGLLDAFKVDMAGDASMSGSCQALGSSGLVAGGAIYFGYFIGNFSGGTLGLWGGSGAPTFNSGGKYGGLYLNGSSPGLPYYNNNGAAGWDRLVGETSTQTLTNKTLAPASISPGSNTQVLTTVAGVAAWAAAAGGAATSVGTTPPGSPTNGQLWYYSDAVAGGGALYIYYTDPNTSQWVPASPAATPGSLIQTVFTETGAVDTTAALIPFDDTIPQIGEGKEFMTLAITPKSATSKLIIEVTAGLSSSVSATVVICGALFQDSTANALAAMYMPAATGGAFGCMGFKHTMTSGTTSTTTFRFRAGGSAASTLTFNGNASARIFGGVMASSIVIQEVA